MREGDGRVDTKCHGPSLLLIPLSCRHHDNDLGGRSAQVMHAATAGNYTRHQHFHDQAGNQNGPTGWEDRVPPCSIMPARPRLISLPQLAPGALNPIQKSLLPLVPPRFGFRRIFVMRSSLKGRDAPTYRKANKTTREAQIENVPDSLRSSL